jgi:regulator of sigma E protease
VNVFVAILGLGLLILVHEAGHFFTARAVGMSPRKFYIGFPPPLIRATRNGIEYGIGTIPLGGYVKIPGMHRPAPSDLDVRGPYFGAAVVEEPSLRPAVERVKERLAEGDMAGARGLLDDLERALADARISPRALKAAERGLRELRDGLGDDAYWRQRTWKKVSVIFAGPGTNLVFAIVLFFFLFLVAGGKATTTIEEVAEGRPAAQAGLQPGDEILAINGEPVEANEISDRITSSEGRPLTVVVRREGERVTIGPVRPREEDGAYRLGFRLDAERLGPAESLWQSLRLTGLVTKEIGASLGRLVTGEGREEISSPVGIVQGSSNALEDSLQTYFWVLGLISLSLALLNLLPLLPLDGGHIAFSIVEGIRGRSVGREVYERVSAIGIALVLLLFFVGLSNDVGRLQD